MKKKLISDKGTWIHCLVLSAVYKGRTKGCVNFDSELGKLQLSNFEVMDNEKLQIGQNVELHVLEEEKSQQKKIIVDHLSLESLSKKEILKILKKSGVKI